MYFFIHSLIFILAIFLPNSNFLKYLTDSSSIFNFYTPIYVVFDSLLLKNCSCLLLVSFVFLFVLKVLFSFKYFLFLYFFFVNIFNFLIISNKKPNQFIRKCRFAFLLLFSFFSQFQNSNIGYRCGRK